MLLYSMSICAQIVAASLRPSDWKQGPGLPGLLKLEYGSRPCVDSWSFNARRVSLSLAFWLVFMSLASLASWSFIFEELRQLWE